MPNVGFQIDESITRPDSKATGELMVLWAIRLGIGGFVIDGAIRDVTRLRSVSIPIHAAGVNPAGPYKDGPGEINYPVACDGVVANPGDILVATPMAWS